jgi:hypothetical protein
MKKEKTVCACPNRESNGYYCRHGKWIKSLWVLRGYKKLKP